MAEFSATGVSRKVSSVGKLVDACKIKDTQTINPLYPHTLAPQQIHHGTALKACPL